MKILMVVLVLVSIGCGPGYHDKGKSDKGARYGSKPVNLLSPQARLRKISLHIRGVAPTSEEYNSLNEAISKGEGQTFITNKANSYVKSPEHLGKMVERLDELFGVKLLDLPAEKFLNEIPESIKTVSFDINSMDLIFRKVIKENLDWNQLYTSKEYKILFPSLNSPLAFPLPRPTDLGFFNAIRPDTLPPSSDGVNRIPDKEDDETPIERKLLSLEFDKHDGRVAGVFTTSRFFSRYNTTLLNRNRKRAAALFRILLCDDMKPTIPADEDISDIVSKSFPKSDAKTTATIPTDEIKHGTQQTCMACHRKLDPMGETFRTTGNIISPEIASGALVYPTIEGNMVNIPVNGVGELTGAITSQKEYNQCQVRHFWNWFVGKDIPLTTARLNEVTQEFERLKRRPNDFVAYLVQQPEFLQDQSGTFSRDASFAQVLPMMKQCANCHMGVTAKNIPNFLQMPFGGSPETHKLWISKIVNALDLAGDGSHATMPTKDSGWALSTEEREDFHSWINKGAQDETGRKTIEENTLPNREVKNAKDVTGVFGYAGLRYLAATDLLRLWEQKFPRTWGALAKARLAQKYLSFSTAVVFEDNPTTQQCISRLDQKSLGFLNTVTQEPSIKGPSLAFVKWFTKCELALAKQEFKILKAEMANFDSYLGKAVVEKIKGTKLENLRANLVEFPWQDVPKEIRALIATHIVQDSIGKNVASRENEIIETAIDAADKNSTAGEAVINMLLTAMLQDEFLTY